MNIGFIGLGGMGSRMASRLLAAGHRLTVYDRTGSRAEAAEHAGSKIGRSPREVAESADIVLSSVTDDAALSEVMYGDAGVLAGAKAGSIVIDVSTVHPRTSRDLFAAGRAKDVPVLDAPVSGSLPQAQQGQLVVFVGGEQSIYERSKPILDVLGKAVLYMGPSGSGALTKLCTNTLLGLGFQALAEALALGERGGLTRERLVGALAETTVLSPSQRSKLDNVTRDEYPALFPLRLMFKDFSLVLHQALELSVAMPATAAAAQIAAIEHARETVLESDEDASAVVRAMATLTRPSRELA